MASRILDVAIDQVMTSNPASIGGDASLGDAAGLMVEGGFRHLPVVDAEGLVVGVLSERDLRERLGVEVERFPEAAGAVLDDRVEGAMRPDPITVGPGATLRDVLEILADERIGALPVVDEGERLVGIVSFVDVVRYLREQDRAPKRPRQKHPARHAKRAGRSSSRP